MTHTVTVTLSGGTHTYQNLSRDAAEAIALQYAINRASLSPGSITVSITVDVRL